ncbi:MAG: 16S rRNA (guanine(527)-N(7))-methyltransferase RsmG [Deltaproteobacteria bacterium]|nr:16S rRNA (guanine(527)-N(7))-methyltransferase RsmG [Deltaproteobacteria bacterium]
MSSVYRDTLLAGAARLGLEVSDSLADGMERHFALVAKWAERINLTTVTEPRLAASRHGLDCLLFTAMIPLSASWNTVDVGSGAGFPGIVLALARPTLELTLLEPIRKRTSFLRVALAELHLDRVRVVEGKLDPPGLKPPVTAPRSTPVWPADLIISRATIPPLELIPLAAPRLSPGGQLILTSGSGAPPPSELARAAEVAGLVPVERREFRLDADETRILDRLQRP